MFGLGGAGVWWPGRLQSEKPLQRNEEVCSFQSRTVFWPMTDSTRAEIAVGLLCLSAPGPAHFASDSLNFVRTLKEILNSKPRKKPWGITPNGDLYALVEKVIHERGANSVDAAWVKGHAAHVHVEKGITTAYDKHWNHVSDEAADLGLILLALGSAPVHM